MGTSSRFWLPKYWYISTASTSSCSVHLKSLVAWPIILRVASLTCTLGSCAPWVPSLALLSKYLENLLIFGILALHATAFFIISFTFRNWYPSTEVLRVTSPTMSKELVSDVLLLLAPYVEAGLLYAVLYWLAIVDECCCRLLLLSVLLLHALPENLGRNSYLYNLGCTRVLH